MMIIIIIASSRASLSNGKTPSKVDVENYDNNKNRWKTVFYFLLPRRTVRNLVLSTSATTIYIKRNICKSITCTFALLYSHYISLNARRKFIGIYSVNKELLL